MEKGSSDLLAFVFVGYGLYAITWLGIFPLEIAALAIIGLSFMQS